MVVKSFLNLRVHLFVYCFLFHLNLLLFLNNNEKESIQLIKTKFNENSKEYKVLLIIIKITFHLKKVRGIFHKGQN